MAAQVSDGRRVLAAELRGAIDLAGVTLNGTADRIDRLGTGGIGIVDYKTGKPPSAAAVRAGFSKQLGLPGLLPERGGFSDIACLPQAFGFWANRKRGGQFRS